MRSLFRAAMALALVWIVACGDDKKKADGQSALDDAGSTDDGGSEERDAQSAFGDAGNVDDGATPADGPGQEYTLEVVARKGAVALPEGVDLDLSALTIVSSAGSSALDGDGGFSLDALAHGAQLAIVLSADGTPLLMGWLDGTRSRVNVHTTAEVLLYFAAGAPLYTRENQRVALDLAARADETATLGRAIGAALAEDVAALATRNHAIAEALEQALTGSGIGSVRQALIRIEPGEQSGVRLIDDGPASFHAMNTTRRRGHVFVERVKPSAKEMGDFELPPVVGLNGGVFGALTDIISAHFGSQPTAYGPIDAPDGSFAVPVVDNQQTTYRVTLVGPSLNPGVEDALSEKQKAQLLEISLRGFAKDALIPFIVNVVLGSGAFDATAGQPETQGKLIADLANSLVTDLVNLVPQVPGIADKIRTGEWPEALLTLWNDAAGSNTLRTALEQEFRKRLFEKNPGLDFEKMSTAFSKFNVAVNAAGGVLQAFDSAEYKRALLESTRADQWTLDVLPSKIRLNPAESTITSGGDVTFSAVVVDADDVIGYTYAWKTAGVYGTLHEIDGAMRSANEFCSSKATVQYVQDGPVDDDTESVRVVVYPRAGCAGEPLGSANATITVSRTALLNGDFSSQLDHWTTTVTGFGKASAQTSISYGCFPAQQGNPFALLDVYRSDVALEQTFRMPADATRLSLRTWNNLDPALATVSLGAEGTETVLEAFSPPSVQRLIDPNNLSSVGCTDSTGATRSYDVKRFAGKTVRLRLRGNYLSGVNGTFISFDDVKVE